MPIALFPELAKALTEMVRRLALWERLAPLEEQLLRRARGAFLVKWFGPLVPEYRLNLFIAIDNIDALRARLAQARASMPERATEMNLIRPLSTYAGVLLGSVISPTGGFIAGFMAFELLEWLGTAWYEEIPKALIGLLVSPAWTAILGGLAIFLGVPILLGLIIGQTLGGNRSLQAVYSLLGDVAMMLDAFLRFWDQLTGPIGNIRNPVLRAIVALMHRVANLFAQMIGFVSLVVVKIVPLIPSLLNQWRAIKALGIETLQVAGEAVEAIGDALRAPFGKGSIKSVILGLFSALMDLPGKIVESVNFLIEGAKTELTYAIDALTGRLAAFIDGLTDRIIRAFNETPLGVLVQRIKDFLEMKPAIAAAFAGIGRGAPPSSGGGGGPSTAARLEDTLRSFKVALGLAVLDEAAELLPGERAGRAVGPQVGFKIADVIGAARRLSLPSTPSLTLPNFPDLPALPDSAALHARIGAPAPRDLASDAVDLFARAQEADATRRLPAAMTRRPRSAFADLLRENAVPSAPSERQLALRDAIYAAVGRILPAAFRVYAPTLREAFDDLDRRVYGVEPTAGPVPQHPELELPDSGLLRPVVELLAFRAPHGADAPSIRAFRDLVTAALQTETYRATAPVGG